MRTLLEEPDSKRFRISQEGLPVEDEQLNGVSNLKSHVKVHRHRLVVSGLKHEDGTETYEYEVNFKQFTITQSVNGHVSMIMNPKNTLYVETPTSRHHKSPILTDSESDKEKHKGHNKTVTRVRDRTTSVALGFFYPTEHLFGVPERESGLGLRPT